jgi:outer membrane protein W
MKRYIFLVLFIILGMVSYAQESVFYFSWDITAPQTNKNWIGTTSSRGAKVGYRHFLGDDRRFSAGLDVNWAYYQEYKPTETFLIPGGAITTDYFNEIFSMGITATGQYYFPVGNREHFFPYTGIGLGASRNDYSVYYNIYEEQDSKWGFLARPEAGILIRPSTRRRLGIVAAVHYDYATAGSDNYDYNSFSAIGFQLGVMVMHW